MPNVKLSQSTGTIEVKVPNAEFQVLTVLTSLNKEAHGPAISRASNGSISVAAIYKLLSRLEQRGLVHKREEQVQVGDITAKRVLYKVCEAVTWFSKEPTNETNEVPARRANHSPMQEVDGSKTSSLAYPS